MAKARTELRNFLTARTSEQLVEEVMILHERFPAVREYFAARLTVAAGEEVFANYARQIEQEFNTAARNLKGRPSRGREILRAYKQVAVSNKDIVELTLLYVSAVLSFIRAFGIREDAYFRTVESAFLEAAAAATKHGLAGELAGAFEQVIKEAMDTWEDLAFELRDVADRYAVSAEEAPPNSAQQPTRPRS